MRTVPAGSEAAWRANNASVYCRVTINGVDLSNLEGLNWQARVRISESVDDDVASCELEIVKQIDDLSLSPLLDGSKLNQGGAVIVLKAPVTVEVAVLADGQVPAEADYVLRFEGNLDKIDFAGETIHCKARDSGGLLQDNFIELLQVYGSPGGTDIEEVIQDILDANNTSVTLYSANGTGGTPFDPGDSPGFLITEFYQSKVNVFEAISALATMIGWDIRYRWNEDTGAFQLTLYEPDRAKTTTDWDFDAGTEYRDISQLGTDVADIRNAIKGVYSDIGTVVMTGGPTLTFANANPDTITRSAGSWIADGFAQGHKLRCTKQGGLNNGDFTIDTLTATVITLIAADALVAEATGGYTVETGLRTTFVEEDAASIASYGRRYMEITEASTSQIDSIDEIRALLQAAISDLAEPDAIGAVAIHSLPWAELGDLWGFAANGEHFDSDQKFAPQTLEHEFNPGGDSTTSANFRGKVSGGRRRWMDREGGRGAAPAIDDKADEAATGLAADPMANGIIVTFDDPRAMSPPITDWDYTAVHVDVTSGFQPAPSNLKAKGKHTRFEIGGLIPDQLYYAKCIHYDTQGNAAAITAQVSKATERVATYHGTRDDIRVSMVPNGAFSEITKGTGVPPDGWEMYGDDWAPGFLKSGSASSTAPQHETGRHSIGLEGWVEGQGMRSALFPVPTNKFLRWSLRILVEASAAADDLSFGYRIFDKDKALLGTVSFVTAGFASAYWHSYDFYQFITDADARYAQVFFETNVALPSAFGEAYIDRIDVMAPNLTFNAYQESTQNVNSGSVTVVELQNEAFDNGDQTDGGIHYGFDHTTYQFTVKEDGRYSFRGSVGLDSLSDGDSAEASIKVNGTVAASGHRVPMGASDDGRFLVAALLDLVAGDYVELAIWHNHGSARGTIPGASETSLMGIKVEIPTT